MKKLKDNNGLTLVALGVTIVLVILLVGFTIKGITRK